MVESAGYWIEVTETSDFWLGWWLIAAHTLNVECYRFSGPNRLKTWHWNLIAYSTLDRPICHLTYECINECHSQLKLMIRQGHNLWLTRNKIRMGEGWMRCTIWLWWFLWCEALSSLWQGVQEDKISNQRVKLNISISFSLKVKRVNCKEWRCQFHRLMKNQCITVVL